MKSKNTKNRSKLAGVALAALGAVGLSGKASAQQADSLVAADAIDGVAQVRQLPDGTVELVLDNGDVLTLDANQVTIRDGQVYLDADVAQGIAANDSSFLADNGILLAAAGVVAAGVGIGVGVSGGGGDDPSEEADVLVGSADADVISGLGGDDQISGLAGDDTLDGGAGNDTLDGGAGADTLIGGAGDDTIVSDALDTVNGGEGTDTLDLSSATPGVVIDLDTNTPQPGPASQDGAILDAPGGEVVVEIDDIENVIGTSGDDLILGNNEINVIDAGAGDDTVHTFGGADTVDGGAGNDTILFSAGGGVTVDLDEAGGATATIDGAASDTISNFENVNGSAAGDDNISGNSGVNVLNGQGGDDILNGEGGADTLIGGDGNDTIISDGLDTIDGGEGLDTVDFSAVEANTTGGAFDGVIVDLDVDSAGANGTPGQDGAVLTAPPAAGGTPIVEVDDVENVIGSDFNDGLFGNNEVNVLDGGAGDDIIHGFAGDDFLSGGEGTDTVLFSAAPAGVTVDLNDQVDDVTADDAGFAATGGAGNNVLSGFENVTGSQSDDVITGDDNDNVLNGNGGDDLLVGGLGDDTLIGGEGFDTADFSDIDVPVDIVVDAQGNGTATRDTGFSVEVVDAVVDGSAFGAGLTPETFVSEAVAGNIYFNVHTSEFTGGEIRGQLGVVSDVTDADGVRTIVLEGGLDASQEPGPPVGTASDSEATGFATLTITVAADGTVTYSSELDVTGLAPSELISLGAVSAIHLHNAPAGLNGPVVQDFLVDAGNPSGPALPFSVVDAVTETDTLESIEEFILSDDNDSFISSGGGSQTVFAGEGDDFVQAGGGADVTDGGEGIDTVSFADIGSDVTVNLEGGTAEYLAPNGNTIVDTVTNFENVLGSDNDDTIIGDANDNVLTGGLGNDTLTGGEGFDTADFSDIDVPVDVVLDAQGNGTATRETGFSVEVVDAEVDTLNGLSDAEFVSEAVAGNIYFNVHTADFTGGEIRGQLGVVSDETDANGVRTIVLEGGLDASQEPGPLSDSDATGFATLTITVDADGNATYSSTLDIEGLATSDLISLGAVSAIHLHNAPAGENGPVVQDFLVDAGNPTGPALPFSVTQPVIETDTLESIENIIGSDDGDNIVFTGAASNTVDGGAGDDLIAGGGGTDFLDGGEGNDTNSFQGIGFGVTASLADGTASYGPVNETFTNFENLLGSSNDDNLTGDDFDNVLSGAAGNDTLIGGLGDDTLVGGGGTDIIDGGEGIDTNSFAGIGAGVTATVAADGTGTASYAAINETFTGIENLTGSDNNDVLTATGAAANTIIGGLGDDFISGGGGSDITDGGEGNDTVSFADIGPAVTVSVDENGDGTAIYSPAPGVEIVDTLTSFENFVARAGDNDTIDLSGFSTGVRVDLDVNTPQPGPASQDGVVQVDGEDLFTVTDFENIVGTDFDDVLLGNNEVNVIEGGAGNDSIHTFGGADIADGGEGIDTVLLTATPVGTTLDLDEDGNGTVVIGGNDADTVLNFENISGSNAGDDVLSGNSGVNVLNGNGGNDILTGEAGDDIINGGDGNDTAIFNDLAENISVTENADGTLTVVSADGTDTLTSVETLLDSNGDTVFSSLTAPSAPSASAASVGTTSSDASPVAGDDAFDLADAAAAAAASELNEIG